MSADADLCARGLHPRAGDGPCQKCRPGRANLCAKGLHDLDAEGATYEEQGRTKCRECKRERQRRSRQKKRRRQAEEARAVEPEVPTVAMQPRGLGRAEAARYRHAVMVRRSRGLMP